jgi:acetyl esterase/lipase
MLSHPRLKLCAILLGGFISFQLQAALSQEPKNNETDKKLQTPITFTILPDIAYLGASRSEKLDLYLPIRAPDKTPSPAVIWVHGNEGGKDKDRERNVCETLAKAGYICASIDFAPPDGRSFLLPCVLDCKNAVRFLRIHATDYHVDPSRIAVFGGSLGASVALMVGFTSGDAEFEPSRPYPGVSSAVSAVGDFYGGTDLLTIPIYAKHLPDIPASTLANMRLFSPITHLTSTSPPVFIAQGRDDPLNDYHQSVELDEALTANGVPHQLVLMDGVGHTFDLTTWNNQLLPQDLRPLVLAFLGKYLRGE